MLPSIYSYWCVQEELCVDDIFTQHCCDFASRFHTINAHNHKGCKWYKKKYYTHWVRGETYFFAAVYYFELLETLISHQLLHLYTQTGGFVIQTSPINCLRTSTIWHATNYKLRLNFKTLRGISCIKYHQHLILQRTPMCNCLWDIHKSNSANTKTHRPGAGPPLSFESESCLLTNHIAEIKTVSSPVSSPLLASRCVVLLTELSIYFSCRLYTAEKTK